MMADPGRALLCNGFNCNQDLGAASLPVFESVTREDDSVTMDSDQPRCPAPGRRPRPGATG